MRACNFVGLHVHAPVSILHFHGQAVTAAAATEPVFLVTNLGLHDVRGILDAE